jgi:uncharacterized membrane protein
VDSSSQRERSGTAQVDLPIEQLPRTWRGVLQIAVAWALGTAIAVVVEVLTDVGAVRDVLLAWDAGAVFYLLWIWHQNRNLGTESTAQVAVREDPTRAVTDVVLLGASVVSLGAVVATIADATKTSGAARWLLVSLGISSIVASWFVVHTLFTMTYARAYYTDEDGGIDFNMEQPPTWIDFAYLAFTIGMTFQVSDTDLQTSGLRRIALRHMLLSYLFGAVILAITSNLVAGLSH